MCYWCATVKKFHSVYDQPFLSYRTFWDKYTELAQIDLEPYKVKSQSIILMELDYQYMISYFGLIVTHSLIGFVYSTKRNDETKLTKRKDETKSRNEMTKSLSGFRFGGPSSIFYIPHSGKRHGHRKVPGYHICSLLWIVFPI